MVCDRFIVQPAACDLEPQRRPQYILVGPPARSAIPKVCCTFPNPVGFKHRDHNAEILELDVRLIS
jgi:hypothetical protein